MKSSLRIGAVRYLNMLPYFFDDLGVTIFETPAALNSAMRSGQCDAACMSTIAGIKAGFKPVEPMMGVASNENVGSVFIEPLLQTFEQKEFWQRFASTNAGGFTAQIETRDDEVAIFTAGASEQSLWLVRLLLHWQGLRTSVHVIDESLSKDMDAPTLSMLLGKTTAQQALFLCIGDVALYRIFEERCIHPGYCWDVAKLWKQARGVPCVFATWFAHQNLEASAHKNIVVRLMSSLERWLALDWEQQFQHAQAFLRQKNDPLLQSLKATASAASIKHYFRELDFILSEPYQHTYSQYLAFSQVDF